MYGSELKNSDNIVRYCSPKNWQSSNNEVLPGAFELREKETYLSCFWKEFYKKNALKKVYNEAAQKLKIKMTGAFVVLNVGDIKSVGKEHQIKNIQVKHKAITGSYSGIYNTTNDIRFRRNLAMKANVCPVCA